MFFLFCCWEDVLMSAKPTYKELVKRIQNLEHEAVKHKQTEKTLHESETALSTILQVVPIGIGVVCDRVIKEVNERLCKILGYSKKNPLITQSIKTTRLISVFYIRII